MGLTRRIGTNFFWILSSIGLEKVVFLVVTIYLARVLGVENFGILTAAQIIAMGCWVVVDMGIGRYGTREIARHPERVQEIVNQLLGLRIATAIFASSIYCVVLQWWGTSPERYPVMYACGAYLLTNALFTDWVFMGLEKFKFITFGTLVSSTFYCLSCLLFVLVPEHIVRAAIFWALAQLLSSSALAVVLRFNGVKIRPEFNPRKWWEHFRESVYFGLSGGVMVALALLPILILDGLATPYVLGIFAAPYRLVRSIVKAGTLVVSSFYPVLAGTFVKERAQFREAFAKFRVVMLLIGLPIALAGVLFGEQIIALCFGAEYEGSAIVFQVLVIMVAVSYLRMAYEGTMMATGHQRFKLVVSVIAVGVLIASFFLVFVGELPIAMAKSILLAEIVFLGLLVAGAHKTWHAK